MGALASAAQAGQPLSTRTTTLTQLFPPKEAASLSATLPVDKPVKFRIWHSDAASPGVLVFVSPTESGEPPAGWLPVLEQAHLSWIAAVGFGNDKLSAQRVLAAMMALELIRQAGPLDPERTYIGGMSGGGRIASQMAPRFPQKFSGALYIVGADVWMPEDARLKQRASANGYVFITGERDFNRREMKKAVERYRASGFERTLLLDLPGLAHEYPRGEQLGVALGFLDAR